MNTKLTILGALLVLVLSACAGRGTQIVPPASTVELDSRYITRGSAADHGADSTSTDSALEPRSSLHPGIGLGRASNRHDALVVHLKWKTAYYDVHTIVERRADRINLRAKDWLVSYNATSVIGITRIENGVLFTVQPIEVATVRAPKIICAVSNGRQTESGARFTQACCDSTVRDCGGGVSATGNVWNPLGDPSAGCPAVCSGAIFGRVFCFVGPCTTDDAGNGSGTIAFYVGGQTCDYDFHTGQVDCSAQDFNFLSNILPPNVTTDFTYSISTSVATVYCGSASATKTTMLFTAWKGMAPDGTLQYGDAVQRYIPPGASVHALSDPGYYPNATVSGYFLAQPLPLPVATCNGDHARLIY